MSDISGFDWWFRDRDYVLRERLADVESQAYAASARSSARLSSQLSRLQGSLESRLNALSAAFDAYVELGDLREQLASYSESAAVRREALTAVAALGDGRPATPVDDRNSGYWIAAATNALIARIGGTPDEQAEAQVRELDPSGELFLVASAGVLGHGPEVASRVPALLPAAGDQLDHHQQIIWQAVVDGTYGEGLLPVLLADWAGQLGGDGAEWWRWAQTQATNQGATTLDWIEQLTSVDPHAGSAAPLPGQQPSDSAGLRQVVFGLIDAGHGAERELLTRARALRARIEDPTADGATADADRSAEADPSGVPAIQAVRYSFLRAQPGTAARNDLRAAIAPGLLAAIESETPGLLRSEQSSVAIRVRGRSVPVTADGPDRDALATAQRTPVAADPALGNPRLYGFAGGTGGCLLLALILAIAGVSAGVVILVLIVGVVLGILAGRVLLGRRHEQQQLEQQRTVEAERMDQAARSARESDSARRAAVQQSAAQLDRIRAALSS